MEVSSSSWGVPPHGWCISWKIPSFEIDDFTGGSPVASWKPPYHVGRKKSPVSCHEPSKSSPIVSLLNSFRDVPEGDDDPPVCLLASIPSGHLLLLIEYSHI